jgi:hypothetical protein
MGRPERGPFWWIQRAIAPLPVPVDPWMITGAVSVWAASSTKRRCPGGMKWTISMELFPLSAGLAGLGLHAI